MLVAFHRLPRGLSSLFILLIALRVMALGIRCEILGFSNDELNRNTRLQQSSL